MLTVFPFYEGDVEQMLNLLEWIADLGGCAQHEALLVADAGVDYKRCLEVRKVAAKSFKTVTMISNDESVSGWIEGPKSLFLAGTKWAKEQGKAFLQMETDAIPLDKNWLDKIEQEYVRRLKMFMGHLYKSNAAGFPEVCLSGIAVYPSAVYDYKDAIQQGRNWDLTLSNFVIPMADNTPLIHHRWGEKDLPPTFRARTIALPVNGFTLDDIPKEAVIWHRNKDGTLIELLREKYGLAKKKEGLAA